MRLSECPHCGRGIIVERLPRGGSCEALSGETWAVATGRCTHPACARVVVGLADASFEKPNILVTPGLVLRQRRRRRVRAMGIAVLFELVAIGVSVGPYAAVACSPKTLTCSELAPAATALAGALLVES